MSLVHAIMENDTDYMRYSKKAKKVLTRYGVCSTFDMYSKSIYKDIIDNDVYRLIEKEDQELEWSPDSEYFTSSAKHPERIKIEEFKETKRKVAGVVILKDLLLENKCYYHGKRFRIMVHQPNETPHVPNAGIYISYDRNTSTALKIRIKNEKSFENMRNINPNVRNCLFEDEKDLWYFKSYSRTHCEIECINHDMYNPTCRAVEEPRPKAHPDVFCVADYVDYYLPTCKCPANCNFMQYKIVSDTAIESDKIFNELKLQE